MRKKRKTRAQVKRTAVILLAFLAVTVTMSALCISTDGNGQQQKTAETIYAADIIAEQPEDNQAIVETESETIQTVIETDPETNEARDLQTEPQSEQMPETEEITSEEPETMYLSEADSIMLAKIAMAEAEGEDIEGKALVIRVVLNRVQSCEFPDTISGVIFQNGQFSPVCEGGRYYTTEPDEECYEALALILNGWDESSGALFFESSESSTWQSRNLEFLFQYGGHKFYR